ncbi:MAG TPA: hypothetical protein VF297_00780 [Pyrinomonadaceae bacterium]
MKQLLELLTFTNLLADAEQRKRATFKGEDLKVTDANRAEVIREAEAQARAFAASRNKNQGTTPKAHTDDEAGVVAGVEDWLARQRVRGHGRRKK